MIRLTWIAVLAALLAMAGCTLQEMKEPPSSTPQAASTHAAPKGWRQTGTMVVGGREVPVYSEIYRGEGESQYQMALNPASGKVQAFFHDEVGTLIWMPGEFEGSAPAGEG